MSTMLQVKLSVLILVIGAIAVAGTGTGSVASTGDSSLCNFRMLILTPIEQGAGTDSSVLVGIYDKGGSHSWTHKFSGKYDNFTQGGVLDFKFFWECFDPCRLTLSISGGSVGTAWWPSYASVNVYEKGGLLPKYSEPFVVKQWVYEGYPIAVDMCRWNMAASSSVI